MSHRPASDTADLFREVFRRLDAIDAGGALRVGSWVLSENDAGEVVLTSPAGRTVVLTEDREQVTIVQQTITTEEPT